MKIYHTILLLMLSLVSTGQTQYSIDHELVCWDSMGVWTTLSYRVLEVEGVGSIGEYRDLLTNERVTPSVGTIGDCNMITSREVINSLDTLHLNSQCQDTSIYNNNGVIAEDRAAYVEQSLSFSRPDSSRLFLISHKDSLVMMTTANAKGTISTRTDRIEMNYLNTGIFYLNDTAAVFQDYRNFGSRSGVEYAADYSVDFTDRSHIDKGFFDANNDWGAQVALTDGTINGDGTTGNVLGVDTSLVATQHYVDSLTATAGDTSNYLNLESDTLQTVNSSVCFGAPGALPAGTLISDATFSSVGTHANRRMTINSVSGLWSSFSKGDVVFVSDGSPDLPAGYYAIQIKRSNTSIVIDYTGAAGTSIGTATVTAYPNPNPTPDTVRLDNGTLTIDDNFQPSGRRPILSGGFNTAYTEVIDVLDSILVTNSNRSQLPNGYWKVYDPTASTIIVDRIISSMSPLSYAGQVYQIKWNLNGWNAAQAVTDSVCFQGAAIFNSNVTVNNIDLDLTPTKVLTINENTGVVGYADYRPYDTIDLVIQHTPGETVISANASNDFTTTPIWHNGAAIVSVFFQQMGAGTVDTDVSLLITDDSGTTISRFGATITTGSKYVVGTEPAEVSLNTGDKIQVDVSDLLTTPDATGLIAVVRIRIPD